MNYEQKHQEDLEAAKGWLAIAKENDNKIAIQILENLFPELRESEDEKIRKFLIKQANSVLESITDDDEEVPAWKSALSWLEKQGKQKPIPKYKIGDIIEYRGEKYTITNVTVTDNNFYYDVSLIEEPSDLEEVVTAIGMAAEEQMFKIWQNPTLSEEDEKIRKALIDYFDDANKVDENPLQSYGIHTDKAIAWLEKQGEQDQKHFELKAGHWYICHRAYCCRADHLTVKEGERFMCEKDGVVKGFVIKDPEKYFKEVCAPAPIENEQKTTDKVGPKFKVGDWIVQENIGIYKVIEICESWYEVLDNKDNHYSIGFDKEDMCHLWTIQDTKDGDVLEFGDHGRLVVGIASYVNKTTGKVDVNCLLENNNFKIGIYYNLDTIKPHPATKEQCDTLERAMTNAGYRWNKEELKLEKI